MPTDWPTAADLMTSRPVTLPPEAPVSQALGHMRAKGFHEIPVVRRSRLLGMVTFETIARRTNRSLTNKVEHLLVLPPLITPTTPYLELAERLLATGLRAAPVVGRRGELLGIVSRTDLVRALPKLAPLLARDLPPVETVASFAVDSIREDEPFRHLMTRVRSLEEHPLPVVDRKGKLVGAVGVADLGKILWKPDPGGKRELRTRTSARDVKVGSVMRVPPVTVPAGSSVLDAARRMTEEKVSSVFVVDRNRPVGVLGQIDVLNVVLGRVRPRAPRAGIEDVYVEITGLRGSGDPALFAEIDDLVARGLRRLSRYTQPTLLSLHFAPHATHRTNDLTVEARLHTNHGIFYASHTGWNLLAGVSGLLDELAGQTRRLRETRSGRRGRSVREGETEEETPSSDPELEERIRAATEPDQE